MNQPPLEKISSNDKQFLSKAGIFLIIVTIMGAWLYREHCGSTLQEIDIRCNQFQPYSNGICRLNHRDEREKGLEVLYSRAGIRKIYKTRNDIRVGSVRHSFADLYLITVAEYQHVDFIYSDQQPEWTAEDFGFIK